MRRLLPMVWLLLLSIPVAADETAGKPAPQESSGATARVTRSGERTGSISVRSLTEDTVRTGGEETSLDLPFPGSLYSTHRRLNQNHQGQTLYHQEDHDLYLLNDFSCALAEEDGQSPLSCGSTLFVMRPGSKEEGGGYVEMAHLDGDFYSVEFHPSAPIFAAISDSCCDGPVKVTVYDIQGDPLCNTAELYPGIDWSHLDVHDGSLVCPGTVGRRVQFASWKDALSDGATGAVDCADRRFQLAREERSYQQLVATHGGPKSDFALLGALRASQKAWTDWRTADVEAACMGSPDPTCACREEAARARVRAEDLERQLKATRSRAVRGAAR